MSVFTPERRQRLACAGAGHACRSVNPNPESQRVLAQIFGLRKRPSQFGRALSNKRESRRERNMPKNAGNSPHGGTKYPVSSVNSKARNFEVEISAP